MEANVANLCTDVVILLEHDLPEKAGTRMALGKNILRMGEKQWEGD